MQRAKYGAKHEFFFVRCEKKLFMAFSMVNRSMWPMYQPGGSEKNWLYFLLQSQKLLSTNYFFFVHSRAHLLPVAK